MSDLVASWRRLSFFWRTFVIALPLLMVTFAVLYGLVYAMPYEEALVLAAFSALIWSAAIASFARMRERFRER